MTERRYQMTRVRAGDYLLPSNDGARLWRLSSYEENGSLEESDGEGGYRKVVGTFWSAWYFPGTLDEAQALLDRDADEFLDFTRWREWETLLPTRKAALDSALSAKPTSAVGSPHAR